MHVYKLEHQRGCAVGEKGKQRMTDMNSLPLSNYVLYEGTDTDEIRQVLSNLFTEARIDAIEKRQPLSVRMHGLELARSTIAYLDHPGGLRAVPLAPMGCHTIQYPLTGSAEFDIEGQIANVDTHVGGMVSERQQIKVKLAPGTSMLCFNVKCDVLRETLVAATGKWNLPEIRFEPQFAWDTPKMASLQALLKSFVSELDRQGGLLESPAAVASIENALITLMLYGLQHNLSDQMHEPGRNAGLHKVRLVEEYISSNAEQLVDMQTIAQVTGHSANSIFRAFQKYRDYTPMQFLRSVRMDRVRERLLLSQTDVSISKVAFECGFTHLGRFSLAYKQRYGESPSDTVRRVINGRN